MHSNRAFDGSPEDALAIARAAPLATLSAWDGHAIQSLQAPLIPVVGQDGEVVAFEGHAPLASAFVRALDQGGDVKATAIFCGPDAYISPTSYASKAESHRVVPTWNFISAEATGTLAFISDEAVLHDILDRQTTAYEASFRPSWALDDAPSTYVHALMNAICGVRLTVDEFKATLKLSQNKSDADFNGVITGLLAQDDYKARAIAARMSELERG